MKEDFTFAQLRALLRNSVWKPYLQGVPHHIGLCKAPNWDLGDKTENF